MAHAAGGAGASDAVRGAVTATAAVCSDARVRAVPRAVGARRRASCSGAVAAATATPVCLLQPRRRRSAPCDDRLHARGVRDVGRRCCTATATLECVWHGARFDCRTGAVRRQPGGRATPSRVRGERRGRTASSSAHASNARPEPHTVTPRNAHAARTSRCSPPNPELHYLDSAATSQKPRVVLDAMRAYYERDNANPHRGAYALSARATDALPRRARAVARFLGASRRGLPRLHARHDRGAQPRGARRGDARTCAPGDEIVVTALEHHANFVPWQQLARERGRDVPHLPR